MGPRNHCVPLRFCGDLSGILDFAGGNLLEKKDCPVSNVLRSDDRHGCTSLRSDGGGLFILLRSNDGRPQVVGRREES